MNLISFALDNLITWSNSDNMNDLLGYVQQLDIDGVELTFPSKKELFSFKLSKKYKSWLKNLEYVTIHAPFRMIKESDDKADVINQLDVIADLYHKVGAKTVVMHPKHMPSLELLDNYIFNVSIENMSPPWKVLNSALEKAFREYPDSDFCLDVAHAFLWSKYRTYDLLDLFEDRLSQIHFSSVYRGKDHQSLKKTSKDFLWSIEPIKKLDVPLIVEEYFLIKDIDIVKDEIKYIRDFFQ